MLVNIVYHYVSDLFMADGFGRQEGKLGWVAGKAVLWKDSSLSWCSGKFGIEDSTW